MKCYLDAQAGADKDAVAVCAVCGMGLCAEHAIEREGRPHRAGLVDPGIGPAMLILCPRCAERPS